MSHLRIASLARQHIARGWGVSRMLLPALLGVACENPFGGDCVSIGVPAFNITVIDAASRGAPTAVPIVSVTDGAFTEEQASPPFPGSGPPSYSLATERPGTYRVQVRAAGYQEFVLDNVRVTRGGDCNYLRQLRFTVALAKTP